MTLSHATPIAELHSHGIAKLTAAMSQKLALATASYAFKTDVQTATVEDLLSYFPMRYEDRSNFTGTDALYDGIEAPVRLFTRVSGGYQVGKNRSPRQQKLHVFEISASDADRDRKPVVVWWFVSGKQSAHIISYYTERFSRGTAFSAYGKWEWDARRNTFALKISKPDELEILPPADPDLFAKPAEVESEDDLLEDAGDPEFATIHTGRKVPIYRKLGQFQTKRLREIVFDILAKLDHAQMPETLPQGLLDRQRLISRPKAIEQIHFPPVDAALSEYEMFRTNAHKRLIFEEFFWISFALQLKRSERQKEPKGTIIEVTDRTRARLKGLVPFDLTNAQTKVIGEIINDMQSEAPMNRLIQGDVGSGKTIVAFSAMFTAIENGYQAVLMAPTEILAEQHARNARVFFGNAGYRSEMLTGSMRVAEKRKVREELAAGEINALIGTHAVIQEAVEFDNLGLAVIDEQHRFGVLQRAELRERGYNPDILVMTATPIPRSLAMTVYGDLDVSVIDELPPGRTPIKTVVVGEDQRAGVYKGMKREIARGRQIYVVYPLIEESSYNVDLKAATKMFEELRDKVFREYRVGLLHGKMKPVDKEQIMTEFVSGQLNILVSTTVIEVGVDVSNASLMVIEHAERFGLSQLHQLRGRVGRGAEQSFCVLLTGDKKTAVAKERLGIMEETGDGFRIAEKDLELRGQGELLGTRQAGTQTFKIGNIFRDLDILSDARREASGYVNKKWDSDETARLVKIATTDPRFRLAGTG
ncbi:MAG: ATP-dependent DNA helicase RecG [Pyrinomonadaceae bacterium]